MKYEKQLKMILDYFNSITKDMIMATNFII